MSTQHQKQLRRVRDFIRRAKRRGYEFSPELTTNLSNLSTQKLKSLTPNKLYEQATSRLYGTEMSGTKARQIERSLSAKKGAETRRRKTEDIRHDYYQRINPQQESDESASYEDTVLRNIYDMIETYIASSTIKVSYGATLLKGVLDSEIATYGRARVAQALENSPEEAIASADAVIQESTEEKKKHAITRLRMIITGSIPTIEEAKSIGNAMDLEDSGYAQNEDEDF